MRSLLTLAILLCASVASAAERGVVVFSATWCPPCQQMKASVWPDARVKAAIVKGKYTKYVVDVDLDPKATQAYRVSSLPTVIVFRMEGGKAREIRRIEGGVGVTALVHFLNK